MKYINAFIIKFVMTLFVLYIFLGLFNNVSFIHILLLGLIISILGFLLGDLVILPAFENWGATISDFFLVVILVRLYGAMFFTQHLPSLAVVGMMALILSLGEFFFHIYIDYNILNKTKRVKPENEIGVGDYQTEFTEEFKPDDDK